MLEPEAEINFYRIVQEALNNIIKHSQARHADVAIRKTERTLIMTIHDDGRGFSSDNVRRERTGGFGLKGIAERARMLGAKVVIQSAVDQGTTITLEMEIRKNAGNGG
jgi:signal transduction histidine kinase